MRSLAAGDQHEAVVGGRVAVDGDAVEGGVGGFLDQRLQQGRGDVGVGRDEAECKLAAYAIAHSPLVKTAFFASDPNLGRILAAVGYAGIDDLDQTKIDLYLDDVHVAVNGGRNPAYREEDGQRVMKQQEITVRVGLGRGTAADQVWTCDFSHEYVTINADYRS